MLCEKFVRGYGDYLYFAFRVLVGLLFLQHGLQKLFGAFGGNSVEMFSLFGLAGLIEFSAGIAITLGFFTRLLAPIAALELIIAYFKAHAPQGLIPIANGGELALLFVASFLVLTVYGARKWSLERALLKKETF